MKLVSFYPQKTDTAKDCIPIYKWKFTYKDKKKSGRLSSLDDLIKPIIINGSDRIHLDDLYNNNLKKISLYLNDIHNLSIAKDEWEILIGPWLRISIYSFYERWKTIDQLSSSSDFKIVTEKFSLLDLVPRDFDHFHRLIYNDSWNAYIYSLFCHFKKIPFHVSGLYKNKSNEKPVNNNFSFQSFTRRVIKYLESNLQIALFYIVYALRFLIGKRNISAFYDVQGSRKFSFFLFLSGNGYPLFKKKLIIIPSVKVDKFKRLRHLSLDKHKENLSFDSLVTTFLIMSAPKTYIEDFKEIYEKSDSIFGNRKIDYVFSSTKQWNDDIFKIWLFKNKHKHELLKIIIWQHGGTYGTTQSLTHQEYIEKSVYSYFLTWGWCENDPKVISFMKPFNIKNKSFSFKKREAKSFLVVLTRLKKYSKGDPWDSELWNIDYMNSLITLSNSVDEEMGVKLIFRVHPNQKKSGLDIEKYLLSNKKNCNFDHFRDVNESISSSELVIVTQNSTVLLEALYSNQPTVCYWNEVLSPLRSEAKKNFDLLREVGIFHGNIKSVTSFISFNYDDIEKWWLSNEVQEARKTFCKTYITDSKQEAKLTLNKLLRSNENNQRIF